MENVCEIEKEKEKKKMDRSGVRVIVQQWAEVHTTSLDLGAAAAAVIAIGGRRGLHSPRERSRARVYGLQVVALLSLPFPLPLLSLEFVLRRILRDSRLHVEWARGGTVR